MMKVLWPHDYPSHIAAAGHFVYTLQNAVRELGVHVEHHHVGRSLSPAGVRRAIVELREKARMYDLVHVQFGSRCGFIGSFVSKPKLVTLRGSDWYRLSFRENPGHFFRGWARQQLTKYSIPRYDGIITVSDRISAELNSLGLHTRTWTIPSAIDLNKFFPIDRNEARKLLGYSPSSEPWVLFTTVIADNPIKRTALAKQVIRQLAIQGLKVRFVTAQGIEHSKMPLLVNACDVLLQTSVYEGWPNAVKEGLACGTPFVSTDVSDLTKIAALESSCFICAPTASALADGVAQALREGKSTQLRRHVEPMALDPTARKLVAAYRALLALP